MKTLTSLLLILVLAAAECSAFDYGPLMAGRPKSPEAISAGIASGTSLFMRHLEAPESLSSVRGFTAIYRKGVETATGTAAAMGGSPEWKRKLVISVAVRLQDHPKYILGKGCPEAVVPGTGSTYLGMSFLSYTEGGGHSGTGTQAIIQHSEVDMLKMAGPLDASKLPFKLDTQAMREQHAVPVFVWLPVTFDPAKAPKMMPESELPDGTVIVYAVID
ncbi:hypothetical protein [Prosthecobacter sp.]|uniref:hypothetical protein n=1 Tax=Prosthecobacter sp. TaxID=1965333 RepID=UPI003784B127